MGFCEWELVGDSIGLLARNFLDRNFDVIINGYIDEPAWTALQRHVNLDYKVLLLPNIDTVIARDSGRVADVRMGAETVNEHYSHFSTDEFFDNFIKIDNTYQDVEQTISEIIKIIANHPQD